eukprot:361639-Chlamydomonas_euryale.AAC.2
MLLLLLAANRHVRAAQVDAAEARLSALLEVFDLKGARTAVASLENDAADGGTWEDAAASAQLLKRLNNIRCGPCVCVWAVAGVGGGAIKFAAAEEV